ncbi:MAG: nuclear transport factor 2 family protein [Microbacterium sp.]
MTSTRELQESAWDAECRRDLDALLEYFHPDAVFHPAGGAPQQGHAAIRAMTEDFYRSFPGLEIDILNQWDRGESAAIFEFRAHLTDTEGGRSTLDGVCAVEIAEGVFTAVRYYEDAPVPVAE